MSKDNSTPRRGRRPIDPAQRLVIGSIRLTADDWQKLSALGGVEWIRTALGNATPPAPAHAARRPVTPRARRLARAFVLDR